MVSLPRRSAMARMRPKHWLGALLAAGVAAGPAAALAHGDARHTQKPGPVVKDQTDWGVAGDPGAASRTIEVGMSDAMKFVPERIDVRQGETVRFVVRNRGALQHEFVIGNRQALDAHAELMQRFPNMEHDEPYMAHVAPGGRGEVIWTFNRAGEFDFACLIAGHYQAGMVGHIKVAAVAANKGDGNAARRP